MKHGHIDKINRFRDNHVELPPLLPSPPPIRNKRKRSIQCSPFLKILNSFHESKVNIVTYVEEKPCTKLHSVTMVVLEMLGQNGNILLV